MARGRESKKRTAKQKKSTRDVDMTKETPQIYNQQEKSSYDSEEQDLFLLEFFVYNVAGERLAKLNQMFFVPTTVSFEFLDFKGDDAIEVTAVDPLFQPRAGIACLPEDDAEYFYSGRSAMFAFDRSSITDKLIEFLIHVTVKKRMPEGIRPDILVGVSELDFTKHFAALRKEMLECWHQNMPPPKVLEGRTVLRNGDVDVGTIDVFVRMSAFGQTIVTEFEAPDWCSSGYIFKGDEMNEKALTYECRIINSENIATIDSKDPIPSCPVCMRDRYSCLPCEQEEGAVMPLGAISKEETLKLKPCTVPPSCVPVEPCGNAVVLKVSGLMDAGDGTKKRPTVTLAPASEATGPNNPPDPEHDVFILRIGKKGLVGAGEKSDLQLEMRTPKGPERRPPIRYETREIQTEVDSKPKKEGKKKKKRKK